MNIVNMKLFDLPFKKIKEGSKIIEVRLNDEKRQKLEIGDKITFTNVLTNEEITKEITGLKVFNNFEEVYDYYDNILLGARGYSKEEYVKSMEKYYSIDKIKNLQVLAITLNKEDTMWREEFICRKYPFDGTLLKVRSDKVLLPNRTISNREWIEHKGACAIVYVDSDNNILLEKQYRYPFGCVCYEIPAGKLNSSLEDHLDCAKREFEEETGLISLDMKYLGEFAVSLAYSTEMIYMYYTNEVKQGNIHFDDDEYLTLFKVPFSEAMNMCNNGTIIDSKTIIAINLYNNLVNKK